MVLSHNDVVLPYLTCYHSNCLLNSSISLQCPSQTGKYWDYRNPGCQGSRFSWTWLDPMVDTRTPLILCDRNVMILNIKSHLIWLVKFWVWGIYIYAYSDPTIIVCNVISMQSYTLYAKSHWPCSHNQMSHVLCTTAWFFCLIILKLLNDQLLKSEHVNPLTLLVIELIWNVKKCWITRDFAWTRLVLAKLW